MKTKFILGKSKERTATVTEDGLWVSRIWAPSPRRRKPMTLKTPDIWARLKNMAANTLALVTAMPVRICQNREIRTLEVVNNSSQ
jgi:hypothetical protein